MTGVSEKAQPCVTSTGSLYIPRGILVEFESVGGEEFEVIAVYEPSGACSDAACRDRKLISIFISLLRYVETSSVV